MGIKKKHGPGCTCCGEPEPPSCNERCTDTPAGTLMRVVISGVGSGTNTGTEASCCTVIDGTYDDINYQGNCLWQESFSGGNDCLGRTKTIIALLGDDFVLHVAIRIVTGGVNDYYEISWEHDFGGPTACEAMDETLTYVAETISGNAVTRINCNPPDGIATNPTCTVETF